MSQFVPSSMLVASLLFAFGCGGKDDATPTDTGDDADTDTDQAEDTGSGDTGTEMTDDSAYAGTYVGGIDMTLRYEDLDIDCTCISDDDAVTYVHAADVSMGGGDCYSADCNLDMELFFLGTASEEDVFGVVSDQRKAVFNGITYFGSFDAETGGTLQVQGDDSGAEGTVTVTGTASLTWVGESTELK